eukprot:g3758.t1
MEHNSYSKKQSANVSGSRNISCNKRRRTGRENEQENEVFNDDDRIAVIDTQNQTLRHLTICVTGYTGENRKRVSKLAKTLGATFTDILHKKCTHLVCKTNTGEKYKKAIKWGHLHIVTKEWLDACYQTKEHVGEDFFFVT